MIAFPAIDLRGGRSVQLVGGRLEHERVSLPDPADVARRWVDAGFRALHIVDLDAALGCGDNRSVVEELLRALRVPVQVGGGIRDESTADALLEAGADRIIIGTRAIEEPAWLAALARARPGRIVVAADVENDTVLTHGWSASSGARINGVLEALDPIPLAGVLITDVAREGRMTGIDGSRFAALVAATRHPLIAAGGIATVHDLRLLEGAGAAGAVLGMALYTGAIDAASAARDFAA